MPSLLRALFVILAVSAAVPVLLHKQIQAGDSHCCCRVCRQPCGRCCCPAPAARAVVPQTTYQPIIETQYAQQPVIQQRDVVATEYRTEPVLETVPATVVENVTVDEGSYQTVWVPRLTTRAVARTTYQTRTAYHTAPYQVTRRISEYATQTIPYQTVRYVPATGSALAYTTPGISTAFLPPIYSGAPVIAGTYPTVAAAPVYPTLAHPAAATASSLSSNTAGLVPDARHADTPVTPITPRTADRSASRFVPAPSAAQVWQTPRNVIR